MRLCQLGGYWRASRFWGRSRKLMVGSASTHRVNPVFCTAKRKSCGRTPGALPPMQLGGSVRRALALLGCLPTLCFFYALPCLRIDFLCQLTQLVIRFFLFPECLFDQGNMLVLAH